MRKNASLTISCTGNEHDIVHHLLIAIIAPWEIEAELNPIEHT